jgi:hypothetical protein
MMADRDVPVDDKSSPTTKLDMYYCPLLFPPTNPFARVSAAASLPGHPDSPHLTGCLVWRQLVARQRDGLRARGTKKHGLGAQEKATQEIQRLGQATNGVRRNDGLADPGSQHWQPGTRRGGIVHCAFSTEVPAKHGAHTSGLVRSHRVGCLVADLRLDHNRY